MDHQSAHGLPAVGMDTAMQLVRGGGAASSHVLSQCQIADLLICTRFWYSDMARKGVTSLGTAREGTERVWRRLNRGRKFSVGIPCWQKWPWGPAALHVQHQGLSGLQRVAPASWEPRAGGSGSIRMFQARPCPLHLSAFLPHLGANSGVCALHEFCRGLGRVQRAGEVQGVPECLISSRSCCEW